MAKKKKVAKKIARPAAKKPPKPAPRKTQRHTASKPAAPAPQLAKAFVLAEMKFAHDALVKFATDFPEDKAAFQPVPTDTNLLWHLGHLANIYAWFRSALDGQKTSLPDTYNALFGGGTTAKPDASVYPPLAELRAAFDSSWDALVQAFDAQSETQLTGPCAIDTGGFAKTKMEIGLHTSWHDGWHAGQLSSVRRALGLKPIWG